MHTCSQARKAKPGPPASASAPAPAKASKIRFDDSDEDTPAAQGTTAAPIRVKPSPSGLASTSDHSPAAVASQRPMDADSKLNKSKSKDRTITATGKSDMVKSSSQEAGSKETPAVDVISKPSKKDKGVKAAKTAAAVNATEQEVDPRYCWLRSAVCFELVRRLSLTGSFGCMVNGCDRPSVLHRASCRLMCGVLPKAPRPRRSRPVQPNPRSISQSP